MAAIYKNTLLILFFMLISTFVYAAVPQNISYQGILQNASGTPVSGTVSMTFSLYSSATGGNSLWSESQPNVAVTNGRYNSILGSVTPINLTFDKQYYLGIAINSDPEMTPRQAITSVAYSMRAGIAENVTDGVITAAKLGENCAVGEFLVRTTSGWSCGSITQFPNAVGSCVGSLCKLACAAGYGDCNNIATDGCEAYLVTSVNNCGACGNVCSPIINGTESCTNGACGFACSSGYADCDGNRTNGCETNTQTSVANCGGCNKACPVYANETASCLGGICWFQCNVGFGDCDGNRANGCETNLFSSSNNCGACGTVCSNNNGTSYCGGGTCQIICNPGYGNCNKNAQDGCEINLNTSTANCGSCGHACASGHSCLMGVCY